MSPERKDPGAGGLALNAGKRSLRDGARRLRERTAPLRQRLLDYWQILISPSRTLSLGFLSIGGFLAGIAFWGAFNTALEATNTETFCVSCHEMRDNVFQELKSTVHYSNRSGVRATCPDCHVPHDWTHKIARKIQ